MIVNYFSEYGRSSNTLTISFLIFSPIVQRLRTSKAMNRLTVIFRLAVKPTSNLPNPDASGVDFLSQPSDGLVLEIGPGLEGQLSGFSAIWTHTIGRFHLASPIIPDIHTGPPITIFRCFPWTSTARPLAMHRPFATIRSRHCPVSGQRPCGRRVVGD